WRTPLYSRSHCPFPRHRHHRASGRGVVRLNGRDHYTGPWGSSEAEAAYERLLAEWLAYGRSLAPPVAADSPPTGATPTSGPTVNEVILAFWKHAQVHYR